MAVFRKQSRSILTRTEQIATMPDAEKEITILNKEVGDAGNIGRIYLPKECIGGAAKLIIPVGIGNEREIVFKTVGDGNTYGVLYIHKKHIGKIITVIILERKNNGQGG